MQAKSAQRKTSLPPTYPTVGERSVRCTLQYGVPQEDEGGGWAEPDWKDFGTWWARVSLTPVVPNETEAVILYEAEGPYRQDIVDRFFAGETIRLATPQQTLKVILLEPVRLRNRSLVAHCANALHTQ